MTMNMEEINYTNKVVKYNKGKFEIENLKEGTMMMGYLQKVGWVVLKSGFNIKRHSLLEKKLCMVLILMVCLISCIGLQLTILNVKCITDYHSTITIQGS